MPRYSTDLMRRRVLQEEVDAPAWIESDETVLVLLYRDEPSSLEAGERAFFVPTAGPGTAVGVRLSADPPAPFDRSMSLVRLWFEEPAGSAASRQAGAVGRVTFARRLREVRVVPSAAVLQGGDGPYVLVALPDGGTYRKRPIEVGKTWSGLTAVVSGLDEHEPVVCLNAFFLDAERRLQEGP